MARSRRGAWTQAKAEYLSLVSTILEDLRPYWPLTLRQVYYQLVAAGHIENRSTTYNKLSRILSQARILGEVPWGALEDRSRSILRYAKWTNADSFKVSETGRYLLGYQRDVLQSQEVALEVWVEKDALSQICFSVASDYCVPVVVARGFSSVSFGYEAARRIRASDDCEEWGRHRQTRILYFGDLDPSGWEMLPAMMRTLEDDMGLRGMVSGIRCALTKEQVDEYNLPENPNALKETDTRARKYMEQFGTLAVELDALPPATLERLVREAIEEQLDLDLLEEERRIEEEEGLGLERLRRQVIELVGTEC